MKRLCHDCKFFIPTLDDIFFGRCRRFPYKIEYNYFLANRGHYPEGKTTYYFCSSARSSHFLCGPSGKFYIRDKDIKDIK
jgi:YHS domain-containing protein